MSFFKPEWLFKRTVLNLIDDQIAEGKKALISNRGTSEHYAALADGNQVTLDRLVLMRGTEVAAATPKPAKATVKVDRPAVAALPDIKPAKLRSAT